MRMLPLAPFIHRTWNTTSNDAETEGLQDAVSSMRDFFLAWIGEEASWTVTNNSHGF